MNAQAPLPEGWKFHPPNQRHAYDAVKIVEPDASDTGLEQHEKTCLKCAVTRVTIIGAENPRAWRMREVAGLVWSEPSCVPFVVGAEVSG